MNPMISIIVPIYKTENFLRKCLDSIINQTFKDFELILINDGSPDNSNEICKEYCKKDQRIKLINKENGGVSSARNAGIQISKGEYIMFIDSDDWVDENILQDTLEKSMQDNSELTICSEYTQEENGKYFMKNFKEDKVLNLDDIKQEDFYELLKTYSIYGPVRKLYVSYIIKRNEVLFNEDLQVAEDLVFNLDYIKYVKKISIINKPYYFYRNNPNSLTRSVFRQINYNNFPFVCKKMFDYLNDQNLYEGSIKKLISSHFIEGYLLYIHQLVFRKDLNKNRKKYLFRQLNNWGEFGMLISDYIKFKNIKGIYKYIMKKRSFYFWEIYLSLSEMKQRVFKGILE